MRPFIPAAVALAAVGLVGSAAQAAFTFSISPVNTTLIPGKKVLALYALNNGNTGGNNTGTLVKAFAPNFSTTAGKLYVHVDDGGTPGDAADDSIDVPNAAGPNLAATPPTAGNGFGYVRLGTAAQTFQVSVSPASADAYVGGGTNNLSVTETTTANVNASSTVNGGVGYRVAVLVLDGSTQSLTFSGQIGGDVGSAQTLTPSTIYFDDGPPAITPSSVTVDVSPPGLEGFGPVSVSASTGITVGTIPARIADNITITVPVEGTNSLSITGSGFTYADLGTYAITFSTTAGSSFFTLNVVPEPTAAASGGLLAFSMVRRRR